MGRIGKRQGRNGDQALSSYAKRCATGGDDLECWTGIEQGGDGLRTGQHLLAVVENEKKLAGTESGGQSLGDGTIARFTDAERLRDRGDYEGGFTNRGKIHKGGAIGERVSDLMSNRESEPGLADTTGTSERDQRSGLVQEQVADRGELCGAPDQGCPRNWQRFDAIGKRRERHSDWRPSSATNRVRPSCRPDKRVSIGGSRRSTPA